MAKAAMIYTGGVNHPFEDAAPALARILESAGFHARVSYELPEVLAALRADPTALLVIYALRWSMTQHEKYAPDRARWGLQLAAADREAITAHVQGGAGLLGVHTASICFDDWPEWPQLLGAGWQWGRSYHPAPGPVTTRLSTQHLLTRGLDGFVLTDEVYSRLRLASGVEIAGWAEARAGACDVNGAPVETDEQPFLLTQRFGAGRAVYDSLGHDSAALNQATHSRLLQRAALWASGHPDEIVALA